MKETSKTVECVSPSSRFYKKGQVYIVYKDQKGEEYVKGSDGLCDPIKSMSSKFKDTNKERFRLVDDD